MQPIYENIKPNPGSSFNIHKSSPGCSEPYWHIHPEFEIVYVDSGSAERHIGGNVSRYFDGDLMMIGSNIPHSNLGNDERPDNFEIVIQMGVDFVEKHISAFPEFAMIEKMFKRSVHGISFGKDVKKEVGLHLQKLNEKTSFERLIRLIEILQLMAFSKDYVLLNTKDATIEIQSNDYSRVNKINKYVSQNFHKPIQLREMADLVSLTETSFSRFFKKVTGKTFITFLNEYRVQKACSFLANKNSSISEVMSSSGFFEPAHFTRTFKKYTKLTPREYRSKLKFW